MSFSLVNKKVSFKKNRISNRYTYPLDKGIVVVILVLAVSFAFLFLSFIFEVANADSPHKNYTQNPEQCATCHAAHTGTTDQLLRAPVGAKYKADFCYTCHDGSGSQYNTKAAVHTNANYHPIGSRDESNPNKIDCTSCHDPHGNKKPDGTYYARLLKSKDKTGNIYNEGNEFCGACHGSGSTLIGGDHLTVYSGIPHNTELNDPNSGSKIRCLNCHKNNNSGTDEGEGPHGSDFSRITRGNEEDFCYICHNTAVNSFNSINIEGRFTAGASNRTRHDITDADQATSGAKVECLNCHNPHKNDREYMNADPDKAGLNKDNYTTKVNDITLYPKAILQPKSEGKDTFVWGWGSDSNYGSYNDIWVGKRWGFTARALLEFDLSTFPTDAIITSATLEIRGGNGTGVGDMTMNLHRNTTSSWNEASVRASNAPGYSSTIAATTVAPQAQGWRSFDITTITQKWIDGTFDNFGVTIKADDATESDGSDMYREFKSSDYSYSGPSSTSARPKLTIQFDQGSTPNPPKVIDTINFCKKCHDGEAPSGIKIPGDNQSLTQIFPNYDGVGLSDINKADFHGARVSTGPASGSGSSFADEMQGPYYFGTGSLRCVNCHDPHGSNNVYNLRETINGNSGISLPDLNLSATSAINNVKKLCQSCHTFYHDLGQNCFNCHFHGANTDSNSNTWF